MNNIKIISIYPALFSQDSKAFKAQPSMLHHFKDTGKEKLFIVCFYNLVKWIICKVKWLPS